MNLRSMMLFTVLLFPFAQSDLAQQATPTPPMGWNSYMAYDSNINEEEFRANVDVLARELKPFGWKYAVIDFLWYNPVLGTPADERRKTNPDLNLAPDGRPIDRLTVDAYSRLVPSENRFPSSANGSGFKPIADYVHSKGLKFGIHIMRGIPRQAYFDKTPILGSKFRADEVADTDSTCPWLNYMYGVDATKPGAQAYYDSLFALYASWGVDLVKVDDVSAMVYHAREIEMIHAAIARSGRPMVLSLSPGETPLGRAAHVGKYATMWRLSADFWDNWPAVVHMFDLLNAWSPFAGDGRWPDADMLPIGHIGTHHHQVGPDRQSNFTWPEHYTVMTLWSISRSPLMMGGDLLTTSAESLAFLKNPEVIEVNQHSRNGRQVKHTDSEVVWIADSEDGGKYLALFNLTNERHRISFHLNDEMLRGRFAVRDLWMHQNLNPVEGDVSAELDAHGAALYTLRSLQ